MKKVIYLISILLILSLPLLSIAQEDKKENDKVKKEKPAVKKDNETKSDEKQEGKGAKRTITVYGTLGGYSWASIGFEKLVIEEFGINVNVMELAKKHMFTLFVSYYPFIIKRGINDHRLYLDFGVDLYINEEAGSPDKYFTERTIVPVAGFGYNFRTISGGFFKIGPAYFLGNPNIKRPNVYWGSLAFGYTF